MMFLLSMQSKTQTKLFCQNYILVTQFVHSVQHDCCKHKSNFVTAIKSLLLFLNERLYTVPLQNLATLPNSSTHLQCMVCPLLLYMLLFLTELTDVVCFVKIDFLFDKACATTVPQIYSTLVCTVQPIWVSWADQKKLAVATWTKCSSYVLLLQWPNIHSIIYNNSCGGHMTEQLSWNRYMWETN